ncbi:Dapper-like protein 3 [Larimichthys crocea]|uniref:Uncharacterized protein n=1 Tax=Larimichthys crocea TaxID=215358 RepID=A0ACD3R355_LARCR|nr:Dapper-like protein 3 [Larimichthys crocea]
MSLQELPGSFGVMFPAFSLPMKAERSRNKERLEASLAGLCELELLKQRQECRVLSALCLGDSPVPGRPPWGSLRSARCALDAPKGNASEDFNRRLQAASGYDGMDPLPDAEYVEFNDMLLPNISFIHTVDLSELNEVEVWKQISNLDAFLVDFQLQL